MNDDHGANVTPIAGQPRRRRRRSAAVSMEAMAIAESATGQGYGDGLIPAPTNPMAVARHFLASWTDATSGALTLRSWRGAWMQWQRTHWTEVDPAEIRAALYALVEHSSYLHVTKTDEEVRSWAPTKRKIGDLSEALAAITHLSSEADTPGWLVKHPTSDGETIPPGLIVSCENGLLHLGTRQLYKHTPHHFNVVSVPFAYDPEAEEPKAWLHFLHELWPNDPDSIRALQEFFGVIVSGRTDLQKILMVIGPARAGKGTIGRILIALVGPGNVASPTLTSMATPFGTDCLLGKPLAIIADARLGKGDSSASVEKLLSISGEDSQTVPRKYRTDWIGRLPTRFVIMSNELPKLTDATGVIVSRLILLSLTKSWLGSEDVDLEDKLTAELPGIFRWALQGLDRVQARGRITEPGSSVQSLVALRDAIAPHSAFVRDCLDLTDPNARTTVIEDVWAEWKRWCEDQGRHAGTKNQLGIGLRSVIPGLREYQPGANHADRRRRYVGVALSPQGESRWPYREETSVSSVSCGPPGGLGTATDTDDTDGSLFVEPTTEDVTDIRDREGLEL